MTPCVDCKTRTATVIAAFVARGKFIGADKITDERLARLAAGDYPKRTRLLCSLCAALAAGVRWAVVEADGSVARFASKRAAAAAIVGRDGASIVQLR